MLRYARVPAIRHYPVELSGWDSTQTFFVETCDLLWAEDSSKHVTLRHHLSPNAILFVRLLDTEQTDRRFPVAYQSERIGESVTGATTFRLKALLPRTPAQEGSVA